MPVRIPRFFGPRAFFFFISFLCSSLLLGQAYGFTLSANDAYVFMEENEVVNLDSIPANAMLLGTDGQETIIFGENSRHYSADANVDKLRFPDRKSAFSILPRGSGIAFRKGDAGITVVSLNQPLTVEFKDVTARYTVTALNVFETEELSRNEYLVGGTVRGLSSGELTLALNEGDALQISNNGAFSFPTALATDASYEVVIIEQPAGLYCQLQNAVGDIQNANVSDILVTCNSSGNSYTLSGLLIPQVGVVVDSDINDPNAELVANDDASTAQIVNVNQRIHGFASHDGTGFNGDRFNDTGDVFDVYKVDVPANYTARLHVVDFSGKDRHKGDLDLNLYDANLNLVTFSMGVDEFEAVEISEAGTYYVVVEAWDDSADEPGSNTSSKYTLEFIPMSERLNKHLRGGATNFLLNQALVRYTSGKNLSTQQDASRRHPAKIRTARPSLYRWSNANAAKIYHSFDSSLQRENPAALARKETLRMIKRLNSRDDIKYAEPNYLRHALRAPDDSLFGSQWHYQNINLPEAWNLTTGSRLDGQQVVVGVIDTGVFLNHADLKDKLVPGYDFISDISGALDGDGIDNNPDDPGDLSQIESSSWHGTHVAGTIAASSNNASGVAGVSWGAKLMPLRVLGKFGGSDYDITQAMLFAAGLPNDSNTIPAKKADVINLSLGGPGFSTAVQDVVNRVRAVGVVIVAAAGNENSSQPSYPAAYDGVISVSATDFADQRAPYSNFGNSIDVAAPGGDVTADKNGDGRPDGVLSALVDDSSGVRLSNYDLYQGTSMAAPHVAGVIALMKAIYPRLSPTDVDSLLVNEKIVRDLGPPGRDNLYGYGLIDALKSVRMAKSLANGGVVPELPPLVQATPSTIWLGLSDTASFTLKNVGGGNINVSEVLVAANWLTAVKVGDSDLGEYRISVRRGGLVDARYKTEIVVELSNSDEVRIPVTMQVGSFNGVIPNEEVYLLLVNPDYTLNQSIMAEKVEGTNNYRYRFDSVNSGRYLLFAGSDTDNDMFICQAAEICGAYPVSGQMELIDLVNHDLEGLNFNLELKTNPNIVQTRY